MARTESGVTLTTEQATDVLGWLWSSPGGSGGDLEDALASARRRGADWDWPGSALALERAYRLLGAEAPECGVAGAGYAWHRGEHPIQAVASELRAMEDASTDEWLAARWEWRRARPHVGATLGAQ